MADELAAGATACHGGDGGSALLTQCARVLTTRLDVEDFAQLCEGGNILCLLAFTSRFPFHATVL